MLLTTGVIALSRKVRDERAKKQQAKQGLLRVGDSDTAKRAFESQTSKMLEGGNSSISRAGAEILYEDPNDVTVESPDGSSDGLYSLRPETKDTRRVGELGIASPVESVKAALSSPTAETPMTAIEPSGRTSRDQSLEGQRYSSSDTADTTLPPPSSSTSYSSDWTSSKASDTKSISSRSTNSRGTHAVRIKTKGIDLNSGFPYHPALFDLRVHPEQWESFTTQIIETTKLSTAENAKVWGAATATALTGAIGTSIFVGNSVKRAAHEKKVKAGLVDNTRGGLGDTLRLWNEEQFARLGLFVHLELSESTIRKSDAGRTNTFRKPAIFYSSTEERERKREERKFVIVVTKLDDEGQPTEALREIAAGEEQPVEIGSSGVPEAVEMEADLTRPIEMEAEVIRAVELPGQSVVELPAQEVAELPAEEVKMVEKMDVELPAEDVKMMERKDVAPPAYVEMDGDNQRLMEKLRLDDAWERGG